MLNGGCVLIGEKYMNDDLISIVVPVYNVEKYLSRCLDCLCNQTYKNIEIICVEDKSPDNSLEICESYAKNENRITIHKNSVNLGLSTVRNVGKNIAKGKYIFYIDSDDFIAENTIQLLYEAAQKADADIVSCDFCYYYGDNNFRDVFLENKKKEVFELTQEKAFSYLLTQDTNYRCVWAKLIKKDVMSGISFPDGNRYGEDMIFTPQLLCNAKNIIHVNKVLYFYSQEGISLVRSSFNKEKLKEVQIVRDWIELTKRNFPLLLNKALAYYYITIINLCLVTRWNNLITESNELKSDVKKEYRKILFSKFLNLKMKLKATYILLFFRG